MDLISRIGAGKGDFLSFSPTLDPAQYLASNLTSWQGPVIVYRAVGKYASAKLGSWLLAQDPGRVMTVLVGAASSASSVPTSLAHAQTLRREVNPALMLGGVAIPERHRRRDDEHLRLLAKQDAGCRFFVTQVVYDVNAAKNLVSDYHYACAARGTIAAPIAFTFTVCGSMRTLEFLRWLGVPFGINVESVSIRRVEIEMAVRLAEKLSAELRR